MKHQWMKIKVILSEKGFKVAIQLGFVSQIK
jgi:hypothetical protein